MGIMDARNLLSIGEFAGLTHLSVKALRHYDDQGLVSPVHVDPLTRYRYYSLEQRERAALIGVLRSMDVPLHVVRTIIDGAQTPDEAVAAFHEWWDAQERRHAERRGIERYVTSRLRHQGVLMNVLTRTVPSRHLAFKAKELYQPELDAFIMDSFVELFDYASAHPGLRPIATTPEWPTYAIFHGTVSADQSALVEVCIVVNDDAPAEGDIRVRVEPEHLEAYVELTKSQLGYPEILDAYSAASDWVSLHGDVLEAMPSREVYIDDVIKADASTHVCDVAFPFAERA